MSLFHAALQPALNNNGSPIEGATWRFYRTGTTTAAAVYADADFAVSLGSTVTANGAGRFANIYLDDAVSYRAILRDAGGSTLKDIDPCDNTQGGDFGFVTPEQFGAVGDGVTNDQAAFQAAIDYCLAQGLGEIRLSKSVYRINARKRTTPFNASGNYYIAEGHPLVIPYNQQIRIIGVGANPSRLAFYNYGGSSFEGTTPGTNFQLPGDSVFRCYGFFVQTSNTDPGEANRSHLWLERITLDGGTMPSGSFVQPANPADGTGWDWSHKGVMVEPDKAYGGQLTIMDCKITGWRGESNYTANNGASVKIHSCEITNSNGSGLNIAPGAHIVDIDKVLVRNTGVAFEGWTGDLGGRITNVTFIDCSANSSIQGGKAGSPTFAATRITADELPLGHIDLTFINCGNVNIGSWLRGKITAIDTPITIGAPAVFTAGTKAVDLDILCITDQLADTAQVSLSGSDTVGSKLIDNINLRIRMQRTGEAETAGRKPGQAVAYGGSLGEDVVIRVEGMGHCTRPPRATSTVKDYAPMFTGEIWDTADAASNLQNVQTTPTIALTGPVMVLFTTNNAVYSANMPTTNVQRGRRARIVNANSTGGGIIKFSSIIATSKVRAGGDVYVMPNNWLDLQFNGFYWEPVGKANFSAELPIVVGDETTAITAGTAKATVRMPNYPTTLVGVRASLTTAQATNGAGGIFTVDVNEAGTSVISTKLTIDNTEKTSTTAATPAVISDTALAADAEITIDVDQVGDGTAKGLKVYLEYVRT